MRSMYSRSNLILPKISGSGSKVSMVPLRSLAAARGLFHLFDDFAAGEFDGLGFFFAEGLDFEEGGEGVDSLDAHTVETNGFF